MLQLYTAWGCLKHARHMSCSTAHRQNLTAHRHIDAQSGTPAKHVGSARAASSVPKENVPANTVTAARTAAALRPKANSSDPAVADLTEQVCAGICLPQRLHLLSCVLLQIRSLCESLCLSQLSHVLVSAVSANDKARHSQLLVV